MQKKKFHHDSRLLLAGPSKKSSKEQHEIEKNQNLIVLVPSIPVAKLAPSSAISIEQRRKKSHCRLHSPTHTHLLARQQSVCCKRTWLDSTPSPLDFGLGVLGIVAVTVACALLLSFCFFLVRGSLGTFRYPTHQQPLHYKRACRCNQK